MSTTHAENESAEMCVCVYEYFISFWDSLQMERRRRKKNAKNLFSSFYSESKIFTLEIKTYVSSLYSASERSF